MSNGARRSGYIHNRVLIEASRVLDTQFNDAVVFLTGEQLEMLRNVTQYLSRRDTYVSEYKDGYYITPTDEDYDTILGIVADMEEALMGNPNTIWGYFDRWYDATWEVSVGGAETDVEMDPVPEGFVYVLEHFTFAHNAQQTCAVYLTIEKGGSDPMLYEAPALPSGEKVYQVTRLTLKEGDYVQLKVMALPVDEWAYLHVWGHMMKVPV